ncbi:MAG: hypothetical protein M3R27_01095 [Bacteroidota bacterium]|nr:hypothetical protein [Bacteroidota bacterium]
MDFLSPLFFLCLFFVILIHRILPSRFRPYLLLIVSLVFIASFSLGSLLAIVFFSVFTFFAAKWMKSSRIFYLVSISVHVAAILLFNYFSIDRSGLNFHFSSVQFDVASFILALGVSFYSLQNIAYLTEVYYKRRNPESDISHFLLYNCFFAKVISGPVMLPSEFFPQINSAHAKEGLLISGFQRLILGLFKKLVIADRLAPSVASVFDHNDHYSGLTIILATCLFTIQLYFDFSGYTDMAIGIGKMLGYELKENFRLPLRAASVSEFWRRWHISLISWFTNYIYYPAVFYFRSWKKAAAITGIAITFLVSALWHGTGLTFLAWGACHMIYLMVELLSKKKRAALSLRMNTQILAFIGVISVFCAVSFSHLFFRSTSIEVAFQMLADIGSDFYPDDLLKGLIVPLAVGGHQQDLFNLYLILFLCFVVLLFERKINTLGNSERFQPWLIGTLVLMIFLLGAVADTSRFIYMQF